MWSAWSVHCGSLRVLGFLQCGGKWQVTKMSDFSSMCCFSQFGDAYSSRLPMLSADIQEWQAAFVEVWKLYPEELRGLFLKMNCGFFWKLASLLVAHTEALHMLMWHARNLSDPRPFTARKYSIYTLYISTLDSTAWSTQVSEYPREYLST